MCVYLCGPCSRWLYLGVLTNNDIKADICSIHNDRHGIVGLRYRWPPVSLTCQVFMVLSLKPIRGLQCSVAVCNINAVNITIQSATHLVNNSNCHQSHPYVTKYHKVSLPLHRKLLFPQKSISSDTHTKNDFISRDCACKLI